MKLIRLIFLLAALFSSALLHSQNKVVKGKVLTLNSLPVSNFVVEAKKSGAQITTDSLGTFSIVTEQKDLLFFKGKVFRSKKVRINQKTVDSLMVHVRFIDTPENKKIAVGYGYVDEDQLMNAVSNLRNNQIDFCSYNTIFDLIDGRFSGVQIVGRGSEREVIIRGRSSINLSNCALYVVDGVVVNSIGYIVPCDVKSIDVLKDSGAAIYGSQGSNGVVLIELRKGNN